MSVCCYSFLFLTLATRRFCCHHPAATGQRSQWQSDHKDPESPTGGFVPNQVRGDVLDVDVLRRWIVLAWLEVHPRSLAAGSLRLTSGNICFRFLVEIENRVSDSAYRFLLRVSSV